MSDQDQKCLVAPVENVGRCHITRGLVSMHQNADSFIGPREATERVSAEE